MFATIYEERECAVCHNGSLRSLGWFPSRDGWALETVCLWCLTEMLGELHEIDLHPILLNIHAMLEASARLPIPTKVKPPAPKKVRKMRVE